MADVLSKRPCATCGGSGREYDRRALNHIINKSEKDLQDVAKDLDITPSHLSKLMRGSRHWSPELVGKLLKLQSA